tara:strand:- start:51 stop:242 length:192 start_codon:yes stop_codon:yes gene_type:complete
MKLMRASRMHSNLAAFLMVGALLPCVYAQNQLLYISSKLPVVNNEYGIFLDSSSTKYSLALES